MSDDGEWIDGATLDDWQARDEAKNARISALTAENAALALQVKRARDDALEEAALVCDNEVVQARAHNCTTEAIGALWSAKAIRALRGATEGAGQDERMMK